jgi:hypothetical protein
MKCARHVGPRYPSKTVLEYCNGDKHTPCQENRAGLNEPGIRHEPRKPAGIRALSLGTRMPGPVPLRLAVGPQTLAEGVTTNNLPSLGRMLPSRRPISVTALRTSRRAAAPPVCG